jgi:nicotinamidase-related amidase
MIVNNVIGLAKTAKAFSVPTILTTVLEERGGYLIKGLQDVFPDQKPIDRTFINTWEDKNVVDAVRKTGRKQLVVAAPTAIKVLSSARSISSTARVPRGRRTHISKIYQIDQYNNLDVSKKLP